MTFESLSYLPSPPFSSSQYQYPSLYLFGSGAYIHQVFSPPPPYIIVPWLTTLRTHGGKREGGREGKRKEKKGGTGGVGGFFSLSHSYKSMCARMCMFVCAVRIMCVCSASTQSILYSTRTAT